MLIAEQEVFIKIDIDLNNQNFYLMKKITFLSVLILFLWSNLQAQCIRPIQQLPAYVSNNSGLTQALGTSCVNMNQYIEISGLIAGQDYIFTSRNTSTQAERYITITTTDNTVIGHGPSPLTVAITAENIRMHNSFEANCDTPSTGCHNVTMRLIPSCPFPVNTGNTAISDTAASFTWIAGGTETAWDVLVLPATATAPTPSTTEGVVQVNTPSYTTTTPLLPATNYKFYVRAACEASDVSPWMNISFATTCEPVDWFFENFDAASTLPVCWRKVGNNGFVNIQNSTITASPPRALYVASNNGVEKGVVALPALTNATAGTHRLRFSCYATTGEQTIEIGYLTNVLDPASFVYLYEFTNSNTTKIVTYSPGVDVWTGNLAIRTGPDASSIYIDDITWEPIPACDDVSNITVNEIGDVTANVTWVAGDDETAWDIVYGLNTVTNPNTLTPVPSSTQDMVIDVVQNSSYKLWVRSNCGDGNLGAWIGPKTFTTLCSPVSSFSQNFVGMSALPSCWTKIGNGGSASVFSSYMSLYSSSGSVAVVATTPVNNTELGTHRLRVKASQSPGLLEAGYLTDLTNPASFVVVGTFPASSNTTEIVTYAVEYPTEATGHIALRRPSTLGANIYEVIWEPIPTCGDVTDFAVTDVTDSEASIEWGLSANGQTTESAWEVVYGPSTVTDPDTLTVLPATEMAMVLDVAPLTSYKVWVRSDCGTDKGFWVGPITFTTPCSEGTTITQNFDAANTFPDCWAKVGTGGTVLIQTSANANTAPNALFLLSSTQASQGVVSLPPLSNVWAGTHQLKFKARGAFTNGGVIELGYLGMAGNAATFVAIESFTVNSVTAYEEFTTDLPTTPLTGYLAFRHGYLVPNAVLIDDVVWEEKELSNPLFDSKQLTVYPNPVKDVLNLSYAQNITNVAVYNLLGQKVIEAKQHTNSVQIDMSSLASGSYIVKVASDNQIKSIKIIKQ